MKTLTEKYRGVLNESFSKQQFVRDARMAWPQLINQFTGFNDAVTILKQKGMISEEDKMPEYAEFHNLSDEAIRRGVDAELEAMGLMSQDSISAEDQAKAKEKALKNLKKDPLHYLNLMSGESSKVDKHDQMVEPNEKNKVDTFNGMKKAELKEEMAVFSSEEEEDRYIEKMVKRGLEKEKEPRDGVKSAAAKLGIKPKHVKESNQEESIADFIIQHYTNPKTGKSLIDDEIINDFFKTHPESRNQENQEALDNFEEYLSVNYEMPGDYMQEGQDDMHAIGLGYLKGFGKKHSLTDDELKMLGQKVVDSLYKGDVGAAKAKFVGELAVDRLGRPKSDDAKPRAAQYGVGDAVVDLIKGKDKDVDEALSDEDMKAIEKYGRDDKPVKAFKPGDMFSSDFDYEGMLEFGLKIRLNTPIATLQALYDSFEDVNYHSENSHLGMAIDAIQDGDKAEALDHIRNFKKAIKRTLIQFNEGANPNRRELEEAEAVVAERVGALQDFISLIQDRAEDSGFSEAEEAEEVVYAIGDHYGFGVDVLHGPKNEPEEFTPGDRIGETKGKDHDGDGDVDSDDYMAAKDKAIKKAMGKDEMVKENIKAIIQKVLEEGTINEAATQELAKMADSYAGFDGMKAVVMSLQDIVTEIERFYDNTRGKIQKAFDSMGEVRNEEGLKVGGFLAPAVESAFNKDLRPVTKQGFTKGIDQPRVKVLSQADLDAARRGGSMAEAEPKQTVYSPVNEKK